MVKKPDGCRHKLDEPADAGFQRSIWLISWPTSLSGTGFLATKGCESARMTVIVVVVCATVRFAICICIVFTVVN